MISDKLTDPLFLGDYLNRNHLTPARSAGQHFLICQNVVDKINLVIHDGPPRITELGAGLGTLTQALLHGERQVRAIERDAALAHHLPELMPADSTDRLVLIINDLRQVDWRWSSPYQLVGNIPYNLSGLIFRRLTHLDPAPVQVVLLVQKEVGTRLAAAPPDMHLLSIAVQLWGSVKKLLTVPASCFLPPPAVDSQLISITPHTPELFTDEQREHTLKIAKVFFQNRRKQIGGVLRRQFKLSEQVMQEALQVVNLRPTQRPQEVSVEQWVALAQLMPE